MSLHNLLKNAGFECVNYDKANGQQFDLIDDVAWDQILRDIAAGNTLRHSSALTARHFRSCIIFLDLLPLRSVSGTGRYGLNDNNTKQKKTVQIHTWVAIRVAQALGLLMDLRIPWMFETPAIHAGQVSMGHLVEYAALLQKAGVMHTIGLQCPLGAPSAKPTSWIHFMVQLDDMPKSLHASEENMAQ